MKYILDIYLVESKSLEMFLSRRTDQNLVEGSTLLSCTPVKYWCSPDNKESKQSLWWEEEWPGQTMPEVHPQEITWSRGVLCWQDNLLGKIRYVDQEVYPILWIGCIVARVYNVTNMKRKLLNIIGKWKKKWINSNFQQLG